MKASLETSALFLSTTLEFSGSSRKYPAYPETFQAIRKLSRPTEKYLDYPETFQAIRKLSGSSGKYPGLRAKTFRTRKNFLDGNATMPRWFLGL